MSTPDVTVRPTEPADVAAIVALIHELADYENLTDECTVTADALGRDLFAERPAAEVLVAESQGTVVGYALFFPTYSTFLAKQGMWLEDLYVTADHRHRGAGGLLLRSLARLCVQRGYGRLEWSVLDWNQPAIGFYRGVGAHFLDEWTTCRVDGRRLAELGAG